MEGNTEKLEIEAVCVEEWNDKWRNTIPRVVRSNHPRFRVGHRFDFGFVHVALEDGYNVILHPPELTRRNCKHEKGFDKVPAMLCTGDGKLRPYTCYLCHQDRYIPFAEWDDCPDNLPADYAWTRIDDNF